MQPQKRQPEGSRLLAWKIILGAGALLRCRFAVASWFYCACQFASLEANEDSGERHSLSGCLALSSQWFGGGLVLFFMLIPLWGAVWLNGALLALVLPQLLHSIFGLNTLLLHKWEFGIDRKFSILAFVACVCMVGGSSNR